MHAWAGGGGQPHDARQATHLASPPTLPLPHFPTQPRAASPTTAPWASRLRLCSPGEAAAALSCRQQRPLPSPTTAPLHALAPHPWPPTHERSPFNPQLQACTASNFLTSPACCTLRNSCARVSASVVRACTKRCCLVRHHFEPPPTPPPPRRPATTGPTTSRTWRKPSKAASTRSTCRSSRAPRRACASRGPRALPAPAPRRKWAIPPMPTRRCPAARCPAHPPRQRGNPDPPLTPAQCSTQFITSLDRLMLLFSLPHLEYQRSAARPTYPPSPHPSRSPLRYLVRTVARPPPPLRAGGGQAAVLFVTGAHPLACSR